MRPLTYIMKARARVLFMILAVVLPAAGTFAQPYRWRDDHGGVHYTGTLPPASAKDVEKKTLHDNAIGQQPSYELSQAVKNAPVTLYTHPDCADLCRAARQVLERRGIPFTEVVANEPATLDELKRVSGGHSVPLLIVGGYVEKRATASTYNEALDLAGYPAGRPGPTRGAR